MVKNPDIETILAAIRRNPTDTTEFLLGTICSDVKNMKECVENVEERQTRVIEDVEKLKQQSWFIRGAIAVGSLLGGGIGAKIAAALGAIS